MAQQKSIVRLGGRAGTLTFYKGRHGDMARDKTGVSGDRIRTSAKYERTRENAAEFGRAAKAAKELRRALQSLIKHNADINVANRLSKTMVRIAKTDPINIRGSRSAAFGDLSLLEGFEFNSARELKTVLDPEFYTSTVNPETGAISISFTPFVPKQDLHVPLKTTHFRFVAAAVAIDFENLSHTKVITNSGALPIDMNPTAAIELAAQLPANADLPLILVLGIQFEEIVNGLSYPLSDSRHNAMAVIAVSYPGA